MTKKHKKNGYFLKVENPKQVALYEKISGKQSRRVKIWNGKVDLVEYERIVYGDVQEEFNLDWIT